MKKKWVLVSISMVGLSAGISPQVFGNSQISMPPLTPPPLQVINTPTPMVPQLSPMPLMMPQGQPMMMTSPFQVPPRAQAAIARIGQMKESLKDSFKPLSRTQKLEKSAKKIERLSTQLTRALSAGDEKRAGKIDRQLRKEQNRLNNFMEKHSSRHEKPHNHPKTNPQPPMADPQPSTPYPQPPMAEPQPIMVDPQPSTPYTQPPMAEPQPIMVDPQPPMPGQPQ